MEIRPSDLLLRLTRVSSFGEIRKVCRARAAILPASSGCPQASGQ
jgi:hypothetical protein